MKKDIWNKLATEEINMLTDEDFRNITVPEMIRSLGLCSKINTMNPFSEETRKLEEELFNNNLPKESNLIAPIQIDYGRQVHIAPKVFINHSVCMSAGAGITIDGCVQIAPQVTLITVNHDLKDKSILKCKPIHIKKGAWIGARATILAGVTIGENSVVGAGAIVTRDVPDNVVVVGNPAKVIKNID